MGPPAALFRLPALLINGTIGEPPGPAVVHIDGEELGYFTPNGVAPGAKREPVAELVALGLPAEISCNPAPDCHSSGRRLDMPISGAIPLWQRTLLPSTTASPNHFTAKTG